MYTQWSVWTDDRLHIVVFGTGNIPCYALDVLSRGLKRELPSAMDKTQQPR